MRVIQKILLTFAMVVGLSLAVWAQKDNPKKAPPKGTPPVVTPQPKPPPRETPKEKPKKDKPAFSFLARKIESTETSRIS